MARFNTSSLKRVLDDLFSKVVEVKYDIPSGLMNVWMSDGEVQKYRGAGCIWLNVRTQHFVSTGKGLKLNIYWDYIHRHGNPWPTAHITNKVFKALTE